MEKDRLKQKQTERNRDTGRTRGTRKTGRKKTKTRCFFFLFFFFRFPPPPLSLSISEQTWIRRRGECDVRKSAGDGTECKLKGGTSLTFQTVAAMTNICGSSQWGVLSLPCPRTLQAKLFSIRSALKKKKRRRRRRRRRKKKAYHAIGLAGNRRFRHCR